MVKILVSACLLGENCKYNGKNNFTKLNLDDYEVIPFCPEVSGGLSTPRIPCEIINDKVISKEGIDCTKNFYSGANLCLDVCIKNNIKKAILKEKSPSCGVNKIYDGTFSNTLIDGCGITTRLLKQNNIEVINEIDFEGK